MCPLTFFKLLFGSLIVILRVNSNRGRVVMVQNSSLITKKVIAYSFKDLLKVKEFQKISIKDIMTHADYRRQTFYDHFADKFELLEWIYNQEITEIIEHFINYEHWTKIIPRILAYFEKNKLFYQKTLVITEQNNFDLLFSKHLEYFIRTILIETSPGKLSEQELKQNTKFYAYGFTGIIKEWLFNDCETSTDEIEVFLISVIETTIK